MAAFSNGDAAARAALYAEDGQVLPPNSDFVVGRPPIQAFWQAVIDMGVKGARLDIVEVEGHGHAAIEISKFALVGARR